MDDKQFRNWVKMQKLKKKKVKPKVKYKIITKSKKWNIPDNF
jgi:hypothetical protein